MSTPDLIKAEVERRLRLELADLHAYIDDKASAAYKNGERIYFLVWRDVSSQLHEVVTKAA